jgi:hypothetical protein
MGMIHIHKPLILTDVREGVLKNPHINGPVSYERRSKRHTGNLTRPHTKHKECSAVWGRLETIE